MAFTPTYQNVKPVVGGSADVWGGINNDRIGEAYADFQALSIQFNATQIVAAAALARAGGTMTGDVVLANVGPGSQFSVGFRGAPIVGFTANKTLALTDAGKTQRLTGAVTATLTIPPVSSVGFPVDTVIVLRNFATADMTVARGSGVELRLAGSPTNSNKTVAPQGMATLLHEATNVWVLSGVGAS